MTNRLNEENFARGKATSCLDLPVKNVQKSRSRVGKKEAGSVSKVVWELESGKYSFQHTK